MARPREFDEDEALEAAAGLFRERGFAGSSTADLVKAMGLSRQSLYGAWGDKWQLYLAALKRYVAQDTEAHLAALSTGPRAMDGLEILLARVRAKAGEACLAVGSAAEFGRRAPEVVAVQDAAGQRLKRAIAARVREAQGEGDAARGLDAAEAAAFLAAVIPAIRLAGRGGAGAAALQEIAEMALRALR